MLCQLSLTCSETKGSQYMHVASAIKLNETDDFAAIVIS